MTRQLDFTVEGARAEPHAATPLVMLRLGVRERDGGAVEGAALRCQLRIEPQRRHYAPDEEERLVDLFGPTSRWSQTLRPLAWLETSLYVPAFAGRTEVEMPVVCSYDLEVAPARFFHALSDGDVPVRLLFRGSLFTRGQHGLEITPVAWDREALWRLPVALWREAVDGHFPDSGWLRLRRETLDALLRFKGRRALPSWDGVIATLLDEVERGMETI